MFCELYSLAGLCIMLNLIKCIAYETQTHAYVYTVIDSVKMGLPIPATIFAIY